MLWNLFPNELRQPIAEMDRRMRQLQRFLEERADGAALRPHPPLELWADDASVLVRALVPGLAAEDLSLELEEDRLTLAGRTGGLPHESAGRVERRERPAGEFRRTLTLPYRADPAGIRAELANGVLEVRVPRAPEDRPVRIRVTSGAAGAPTKPTETKEEAR